MRRSRIIRGMTAPKLLDLKSVASQLGLSVRTVTNYHNESARRRTSGEPPKPGDFPPPDDMFGRSPVWKLSTIRTWERHRPGRGFGGGRPPKSSDDDSGES